MTLRLKCAPPVLVLHLKRFWRAPDAVSPAFKLDHHVEFDESLETVLDDPGRLFSTERTPSVVQPMEPFHGWASNSDVRNSLHFRNSKGDASLVLVASPPVAAAVRRARLHTENGRDAGVGCRSLAVTVCATM